MKLLGYTVTIYGGNSLHAFYCDKCNKVIYNISEKETTCNCERESNVGTHGTSNQGNGTEASSNAEGSV